MEPLLAGVARNCVSEQWHFVSAQENSEPQGLVALAVLHRTSETEYTFLRVLAAQRFAHNYAGAS